MGELDFLNNVNSGVALAVLGYFGFVLKDLPMRIIDILKQRYSISIQCDNSSETIYKIINNWCVLKFPDLKNHVQKEGWKVNNNNNIALGVYYYFYDYGTLVIIDKYKASETTSNELKYTIYIRAIGLHKTKVLNDYIEYMNYNFPDLDKFIKTSTLDSRGYWNSSLSLKKSFDDIFIKDKDKIKSILDLFIRSKSDYESHGIIYKTGFLFYGPPGSGKSSLARAIASYLNWDLFIINTKSDLPIDYLSNTVILIEELDCFVNNRENKSETPSATSTIVNKLLPIDLQSLLNYIDGVNSPNHCIFVATTNYIDRIDPALKRKGRFDHIFEIPYIDKELGKEMCKRFNVSEEVLEQFEFPTSAANIQAEIFYNKITKE